MTVHEDFDRIGKGHANDIALLKLSEYITFSFAFFTFLPGERVDLFAYPPVCLPSQELVTRFEGKTAFVYGEHF